MFFPISKCLAVLTLFCAAIPAKAVIWNYDNYNASAKTCRLVSWSGSEPSSGKLSIPSTTTKEGVEYTVTDIAPNALNNFATVTQITISSKISSIGNANYIDNLNSVQNFHNCPKLAKFIVNSNNSFFYSDNNGVLYGQRDSRSTLLKVPQSLNVNNGIFNIASGVTCIVSGAFSGNTTISTIVIPKGCTNISAGAGFNSMGALTTFKIAAGNPLYKVLNGALIEADSEVNSLISYPPARSAASFTVPADVTYIDKYAFNNTSSLDAVIIPPTVYRAESTIFKGSSVEEVTIASSTLIDEAIMAGCTSVKTIVFTGLGALIPDRFAEGCSRLLRVRCPDGMPVKVGDRAFFGCSSLSEFPFSITTRYGKEAFAESGLLEVKFNPAIANVESANSLLNENIFAQCPKLVTMDFSQIAPSSANSAESFPFYSNLAPRCLKISTVKFPPYASFDVNTNKPDPIFGYLTNVDKIHIGSFLCTNKSIVFVYSGAQPGGVKRPVVYASTHCMNYAGREPSIPFRHLINTANGAVVEPIIYTDAYSPSSSNLRDKDYVIPRATYYIPGGTAPNYRDAEEAGCTLREMFSTDYTINGDDIAFTIRRNMDNVSLSRVILNGNIEKIGGNVLYRFTASLKDFKSLQVEYVIDSNVSMTTIYPSSFISQTSAVTDVETDESDAPCQYFDLQGRKLESVPASGTLYIMRRGSKSEIKIAR